MTERSEQPIRFSIGGRRIKATKKVIGQVGSWDLSLMVTWSQFAAANPDLAAFGKQRLEGKVAYLATVRTEGSPRVHPVSPFTTRNHLFVYMEPTSPKVKDLRAEPRYALHCAVEDNSGGQGEFLISGHAIEVNDAKARADAFAQARIIGYNPQERYILFELRIGEVLGTVYEAGEPKRTRWKMHSSGRDFDSSA